MAEVTAEVAQTVQPSVNGATTLPPTPEKQPAVSQPPTEKMEHFRTEERAVQLNLKGGEQGFSLAFMIDPNDLARERIINLPDSRRDKNNLTDQQWQRVVILQQENKGQGEHLEFQIGQQKFSVAKADLAGDSAKVWLTVTTGFEVLDFDPGTNAVTVRRIKRNAPIVPLPKPASESMPPSSQPSPRLERKPGAPDWKRKIIDIVPPIAIPFSPAPILENPAVPPPIIEEQPTGLPSEQALTEEGFLKPKPVMTEAKIPPEIREFPALDESLLCPAVSEWTI
ncbi:hypothetical protein HYU96_04075, partial [Candidatus Daviesbacteria bacterium]|nr:hypothetical protein [Candidatus Daviesbacteria bacterium]